MTNATRRCAVEGCDRVYRSSGYCGLHYDRIRRSGSPDDPAPRPERVCAVEGCGRKHQCRGYCAAHYSRVLKHGDPLADVPLKRMPTADERDDIEARILAMCVTNDDNQCLEWTGYVMPSGYGTISWNSREWVVHRAMWTVQVGPIPDDDDWTIDHLCRNKRCVNVTHLEVVTRTENSMRAGGVWVARQRNMTTQFCRNGHEYTPENTRRTPKGYRCCKTCRREAWAKRAAEVNAARRAKYKAMSDAA